MCQLDEEVFGVVGLGGRAEKDERGWERRGEERRGEERRGEERIQMG